MLDEVELSAVKPFVRDLGEDGRACVWVGEWHVDARAAWPHPNSIVSDFDQAAKERLPWTSGRVYYVRDGNATLLWVAVAHEQAAKG